MVKIIGDLIRVVMSLPTKMSVNELAGTALIKQRYTLEAGLITLIVLHY